MKKKYPRIWDMLAFTAVITPKEKDLWDFALRLFDAKKRNLVNQPKGSSDPLSSWEGYQDNRQPKGIEKFYMTNFFHKLQFDPPITMTKPVPDRIVIRGMPTLWVLRNELFFPMGMYLARAEHNQMTNADVMQELLTVQQETFAAQGMDETKRNDIAMHTVNLVKVVIRDWWKMVYYHCHDPIIDESPYFV